MSEATSKLAAALREAIAPFEIHDDEALRGLQGGEADRVRRARVALGLAAREHEDELLVLGFPPGVAREAAEAHAGRYYVPRASEPRVRPPVGDETLESLVARTLAVGRLAGSGVLDGHFMPEFRDCVSRLHARFAAEPGTA